MSSNSFVQLARAENRTEKAQVLVEIRIFLEILIFGIA